MGYIKNGLKEAVRIARREPPVTPGEFDLSTLPAFYTRPASIDEMVDHSVSRILDQLGIHLDVNRWAGEMEAAARETD